MPLGQASYQVCPTTPGFPENLQSHQQIDFPGPALLLTKRTSSPAMNLGMTSAILAKNTTKDYSPAKSSSKLISMGLKESQGPLLKPVRGEDGVIKTAHRGFGRQWRLQREESLDFKNQRPLTRPRHGTLGARQLAP